MPIVIASALCFPSRTLCRRMLFFFMAGLLLHFECVSIGSLSHPAGGRPSHTISESALPSRDQRERSHTKSSSRGSRRRRQFRLGPGQSEYVWESASTVRRREC